MARPASTFPAIPAGILFGVFVAMFAVSARTPGQGSSCRSYQRALADKISAVQILCSGYWLQVERIDAATHSAQVIKVKPFGNWPGKQFIGFPVSGLSNRVLFARLLWMEGNAIAVPGHGSYPNPTAGFGDHFDVAHESVDCVKLGMGHVTPFKSQGSGLRSVTALAWPAIHLTPIRDTGT